MTYKYQLYIPIWFYSNKPEGLGKDIISFTFQSGSIQIMLFWQMEYTLMLLYIPIWFYSNSIRRYRVFSRGRTLHSNLVLFKWPRKWLILESLRIFTFQSGSIQIRAKRLYCRTIWNFTFQSGSIQMITQCVMNYVLTYFTFQSGSIQIKCPQIGLFSMLYFTFQSGSIQMIMLSSIVPFNFFFTFQSGSIQIGNAPDYSFVYDIFTFQSGSIQIILVKIWFNFWMTFTFQSGSIQISAIIWVMICQVPLHSNLVLFKLSRCYLR